MSKDKKVKQPIKKEITFTPLLTKIFEPTAKLLGSELKTLVKEKIDTLKEKKRHKNIVGHIYKVQHSDNPISMDNESIQQLEEFNNWIEGAQDINPDDDILGHMWQDILKSIAKGDKSSNLLIEKLKELSIEEALLLIKIRNQKKLLTQSDKELFLLKKLSNLDLVSRTYENTIMSIIQNILIISLLYFTFSSNIAIDIYERISPFPINNSTLPIFGSFVILYIFLISKIFIRNRKLKFIGIWNLTWLGSELTDSIPDDNSKAKSNKPLEEERV